MLIVGIDFGFIMVLFREAGSMVFVGCVLGDAVEQLRRKVASLVREGEELQRFRRDIDWLKAMQKKIVKSGVD